MYIKKGEKLQDGMRNVFERMPIYHSYISENNIVKLLADNSLDEQDIEICAFLFSFKVATAGQLAELLETTEEDESFTKRIKYLFGNIFINRFMYSDGAEATVKSDAEFVYTLDWAGAVLLRHVMASELVDAWRPAELAEVRNTIKINKNLMTVDFYLALKKQLGERILDFIPYPTMYSKKEAVVPKAFIKVSYEDSYRSYVFDAIRVADYMTMGTKEVSDKLFRMALRLNDGAWKAFSDEEPAMLILCENKDCIMYIHDLVENSGIQDARYCTLDSLKNFDKAFFKINENGELKNVRLKPLV